MPTENVLHPRLAHEPEVFGDHLRLVQPLVRVPVAAVQHVREAGNDRRVEVGQAADARSQPIAPPVAKPGKAIQDAAAPSAVCTKRRRGIGIEPPWALRDDKRLIIKGLRVDRHSISVNVHGPQELLMNLVSRAVTAVATLGVCFLPALAYAQLDAAQLRGSVVDDKGQPIQGVEVEIKYKGETRTPIIKKATTDKKGGFVRVGLKGGDWTLTFRKDGYKTAGLDTYLSDRRPQRDPARHAGAGSRRGSGRGGGRGGARGRRGPGRAREATGRGLRQGAGGG